MINFNVIKGPIITEKANKLVEIGNKYTFEITRNATKGMVKDAVEALYGVKVLRVNILKTRGREKRSMVNRKMIFRSKDIKKAIVELDPKDSIKSFEKGK